MTDSTALPTRDRIPAVGCRPVQAVPGSVLWGRLELRRDTDYLRWLHRP